MTREIPGLVGTATATQHSAAVTGVGTDWDKTMQGRYFWFFPDGKKYTINKVLSATSLTLTRRFNEPSQTSGQYRIGDAESLQQIQILQDNTGFREEDIGRFPGHDQNF